MIEITKENYYEIRKALVEYEDKMRLTGIAGLIAKLFADNPGKIKLNISQPHSFYFEVERFSSEEIYFGRLSIRDIDGNEQELLTQSDLYKMTFEERQLTPFTSLVVFDFESEALDTEDCVFTGEFSEEEKKIIIENSAA